VTTNFDVQAPGLFPLRVHERAAHGPGRDPGATDVPLTISNVQTANFTHNTVIPLLTVVTVLGDVLS